jgi:hypothetical protein
MTLARVITRMLLAPSLVSGLHILLDIATEKDMYTDHVDISTTQCMRGGGF